MSLTETPVADPKPKPRRKRHARANKRPAAAAAPKAPSELAGLTVTDCPSACNAQRCVIGGSADGTGICGHPRKGGLQARMQTPEVLRRRNEAERLLDSLTK